MPLVIVGEFPQSAMSYTGSAFPPRIFAITSAGGSNAWMAMASSRANVPGVTTNATRCRRSGGAGGGTELTVPS